MHVEVRHAAAVVAIADEGSISRAAAVLGVPQPGLTTQLRRIEAAVGGELFVRSREGVVPTPLGERLVPMMVEMVRTRDALMAEARTRRAERPTFRIGNAGWTPARLGRGLSDALGTFDVVTETVEAAAAVERLAAGTLTAAVVAVAENQDIVLPGTLRSTSIVREPVWLAVRPGHPLLERESVTLPELAELDWVRHGHECWFHTVERQLFERFGALQPDVSHLVAGHAEAMSWVREEGAVALVTPVAADADVRLVPVHGLPRADRRLLWRPGEVNEVALQAVQRAVRKHFCACACRHDELWRWMRHRSEEFPELRGILPHAPAVGGTASSGPVVVADAAQ